MLYQEVGEKLFLLPATILDTHTDCPYQEQANSTISTRIDALCAQVEQTNAHYFNEEIDKLDHWAEDLKMGLELELKKLDKDIRELNRQSKQQMNLEDKLAFQRQKAELEKRRNQKRQAIYNAQDEIAARRDTLINQIEKQMQDTNHNIKELFRAQWRLEA